MVEKGIEKERNSPNDQKEKKRRNGGGRGWSRGVCEREMRIK